jgi:hypothetical protein
VPGGSFLNIINLSLLAEYIEAVRVKKVKKSPAGGWFLLGKIDTIKSLTMLPPGGGFQCPALSGR